MYNILSHGKYWTMKPDQQRLVERKLRRGGYSIHTTLDMTMQRAAENALAAETDPTSLKVGAEAMVEPRTGKIRAIATSKSLGTKSYQTQINLPADAAHGRGSGASAGHTCP